MTALQPRLFTEHIDTDPGVGLSDEWYTPRHVIEAARSVLGGIDLDPASCATAQEVVQAGTYYTREQDGLSLPWFGRVWLNPPYSTPLMGKFTGRLRQEYNAGTVDAAVLMAFNMTDTAWARPLLMDYPVCFTSGRIRCYRTGSVNDSPPRGNMFFYLGPDVARFTEVFSAFGVVKL
jgi:ParB family chromosome partitioning protein